MLLSRRKVKPDFCSRRVIDDNVEDKWKQRDFELRQAKSFLQSPWNPETFHRQKWPNLMSDGMCLEEGDMMEKRRQDD